MVFVGKAKHSINKDGRVSIPSKMRDVINKMYDSEELYLVLAPGNVICLYPGEEFEKLTQRLYNPNGEPLTQVMDKERAMCSNAENCKLDGSGRIVISSDMRKTAEIDDEVLIVGALSHIEIWDPKRWEWSQKQRGAEGIISWPSQVTSVAG